MSMQAIKIAAAVGLACIVLLAGCERKEAPVVPATPAAQSSVTALQKTDTVEGSGKVAANGSTVTVNYTGWLYVPAAPDRHGDKFDSSIGREPFTFQLGAGQVIPGWDQGVEGMKVGGKRTLVVPAALAHGDRAVGPLPANADLVFDVELLDVK
jgi:FKBP-type peptidyl-prolyl cis-trans isomerase FkpA